MKVILVSFLLFGVAWARLSCECGKRNAGRIIGGKMTKKNEYPWIVGFLKTADDFAFCGGTIVTSRHILTAAHCVRRPITDFYLVAGAHDINDFTDSTRQRILVDQIVMHPDFESDLALLVTANEIIFNQYVSPACMPDGMTGDELNYQTLKAIGWGRYDASRPNTDRIKKLREVDVRVMTPDNCNGYTIKKVCTFEVGKSPCMGDSGGPMVWLDPDTNRFTLVGIISGGPTECGNTSAPHLNVYVIHYLSWINDMIRHTMNTAVTCFKV